MLLDSNSKYKADFISTYFLNTINKEMDIKRNIKSDAI